ncbi:GNAT family N-acetyltransferase [candidate division KSB1 bacterium]|nr:GNAT family N-acetyltransferase [candidate division KSB1 bacterium]
MPYNLAGFPDLTLRQLSANDVDAFIDLGLPTCAFMHGRPPDQPEKMRKDFAAFVREYAFARQSAIYVLVDGYNALIAQVWLHLTTNRFNGLSELWVWDLTVHPAHRGRGLGRAMFEFAVEQARARSAAELWLLVSSKNHSAIGLYHSVGLSDRGHFMAMSVEKQQHDDVRRIRIGTVEMRPLHGGDVEALYGLWTSGGLGYKLTGRDTPERLQAHLSGPHIGGWGAFRADKMVAATLISSDGRKGWIERLATLPEERRSGLAMALVTAAKQTLLDDGNLVIGALIEHSNHPSRKLFEAAGFLLDDHHYYYSFREYPDA